MGRPTFRLSAERLAGADVTNPAREFRALTAKDGMLPVEDGRQIVRL